MCCKETVRKKGVQGPWASSQQSLLDAWHCQSASERLDAPAADRTHHHGSECTEYAGVFLGELSEKKGVLEDARTVDFSGFPSPRFGKTRAGVKVGRAAAKLMPTT